MRNCFTCRGRFGDERLICPADGDVLIDEGRPAPETGRTLEDRYRLGNLLGEGGMGKVFEATRLSSGAVVALKVLKESPGSEDLRKQARRRFQLEAEAAGALDHPGVIKVHEFGTSSDGITFIAMERLYGATFDELRRAGKFASPARVLELLRDICSVLAMAHGKGIVHRDLKPSNIFLHRVDRETSRVKVLDFGIAKFIDRVDRLTNTGEFLGTLLYMAPEQTTSEAPTTAMDIYALGVILFEALTGTLPFAARSPVELLRLHATCPAPSLASLRPEVSDELDALVARCLTKRPENRFADAGELGRALENIPAVRPAGARTGETRTLRAHASYWVGTVLDERYEVQEWISPSRFGSDVYRATHLRTGANVALRLWRTGRGSVRDSLLEAFRREAKAMEIRHPNVIGVLDLGFNDDCVYIVTDLIDSISLRTLLARKGALSPRQARTLASGAAEALAAFHERGIISGGLSPETTRVVLQGVDPEKLLITPLGLGSLRQIDLLLACSGGDATDRSLDYISPEQRDGAAPDPRSDLYSLALILLEMMGGEVGSSSKATTRTDGASGSVFLAGGMARISTSLDARWIEFFSQALSPLPQERFPSAQEFLKGLPAA